MRFAIFIGFTVAMLAACDPIEEVDNSATPEADIATRAEEAPQQLVPIDFPMLNSGENTDMDACAQGDDGACEAVNFEDILTQDVVNYADIQCAENHSDYCTLSAKFSDIGKTADRLTAEGYGRARIGASIAEAGLDPRGDLECNMQPLFGDAGIFVMVVQGKVARIDVVKRNLTLDNGIGVGSAKAELLQTYSDGVNSRPNQYEDHVQDIDIKQSGDLGLYFEVENDRVRKMRVGQYPQITWIEGCQ